MFTPQPDVLRTIPVSAINDFMTRRGWVEKASSRPHFRYFEHSEMFDDDGTRLYFYFPSSNESPDYPLSVLDFVENEAEFWNLTPEAILTELTGGPLAEPVRTSVPA